MSALPLPGRGAPHQAAFWKALISGAQLKTGRRGPGITTACAYHDGSAWESPQTRQERSGNQFPQLLKEILKIRR